MKFANNDEVFTVPFEEAHHNGDPDYTEFRFGGSEFGYRGFNGQMANIVFGFGAGKFIQSSEEFL